ncbi:MAG: OadG family protein [Lentisphaeria bacterium]|nr:OadG family protein [Lentisphaeria bacterium]
MDTRLLLDGLKAMVLGMGMVYVFLVVMILLMKVMSKLLAPYSKFLVKESPKKAPKAAAAGKSALSAADRLLAQAAIAAVRMHRGE